MMELHIISVRMGAGGVIEEDMRVGQRIIATADAFVREMNLRGFHMEQRKK